MIPALDRKILALAIPAFGSGLTILAHTWVDTAWIGRNLGEAALASMTINSFTVWIYGSLASLVNVGLSSLVARYVGAGRESGARYVASQGMRGAVTFALVLAGVGWFLAPVAFSISGAGETVTAEGIPYIRVYWLGGVVILLQQSCDAIFRGRGNTWIPFLASLLGLGLNAVLDPLLILGWGPIPSLRVGGAALATLLSTMVGVTFSLICLRRYSYLSSRRPSDEELRLHEGTPLGRGPRLWGDSSVFRRMSRVGLPTACSGVLFSIIYILIGRIVAEAGGTAALAGMGVGLRMEALAFVLGMGYSAAVASLVGRALGANDPASARRAAWRGVAHCTSLCAIWGVVLLTGNEWLSAILTDSGPAREHAREFVQVIAFCLVPLAVESVLNGAFGGAGLTVPPMIIVGGLTLVRLPVAFFAARWVGVEGVWWTICGTAILRGILMAAWFSRGTWMTRQV